MASNNQLQPHTTYVDGQVIQLTGPDSTVLSYQYDREQRTFYVREAPITGIGSHGNTHVLQDPIPEASCGTRGLMSSTDKCKLDSLVGTRLGVLGFQGAGFPDDGGWMQGDIILAAGSEFISLERVGNVVRFVVDVPTPFVCASEECFQVYWIQDETEVNAIRPPSCGGRLPGVNAYGEVKVYLFPESTIINPNQSTSTLSKKGSYPSFIFKRYDDGVGTNEAEIDVVLKRNSTGAATVGWAFTPGATGTPECVWFVGTDDDGNRIDFKFNPDDSPGLFGQVLYKGSSITKQMGVITGYETDVLSTNRYKAKMWSISDSEAIGSEITIINLQQWDLDDDKQILDSAFGSILSIGQFVDIWTVKCGDTSCYYCKERPILNVNGLWATLGAAEFGDQLEARPEEDVDPTDIVSTRNRFQTLDFAEWGMTNIDDPMAVVVDSTGDLEVVPSSGQVNYTANIVSGDITSSASLASRHLEVLDDDMGDNIQRPIFLWHRASLRNALFEVYLAKPDQSESGFKFPPIDVLLRAPINTVDTKYCTIINRGTFGSSGPYTGLNWVQINGLHWHDLPPVGALKIISFDGSFTYGQVLEYSAKLSSSEIVWSSSPSIYLVTNMPTPSVGSIAEVLHEEYTTPAARLQFGHNQNGHDLEMIGTVGTLDMSTDYTLGDTGATAIYDNFVQDFVDFEDSATYWQNGIAETSATQVESSNDGFFVLEGGVASTGLEYYNVLRIMVIESRVWMWWNNMLIPPSAEETDGSGSASSTPYFIINDIVRYGKFGLRLWPGAKVRRAVLRTKLFQFSEYSNGQLELS